MKRLYAVPDDFEAVIRVYTPQEGGRLSPAFNGIRWDFAYEEVSGIQDLYMIWPDFFDEHGDSFAEGRPLPLSIELPARMIVLIDDMRRQVHRLRIREGVKFYCHEGARRVAEGRVTRITGLYMDRPMA